MNPNEWLNLEPKWKPRTYEPPTVEQRLKGLEWQLDYQSKQIAKLQDRLWCVGEILTGENHD